ncbi:polysaccharide biosynthesis/export family protein [soil metagenome]|jgi:polysaccharide export outer membrane protein
MKKNIYQNIFLFLTLITFLSSCVSQKEIAYFQKAPGQSDTLTVAKAYIPRIQSGDILLITIGSLNPSATSFFNPFSTVPTTTGDNNTVATSGITSPVASTASSSIAGQGLLVDGAGMIELPIIGSIKLGGLTTVEAKDAVKSRLLKYLKEPVVSIRFLNYRVSVMGEVAKPAVYTIPNESITLPEALSLAGDLTVFGKRDNILIIRDNDGKKEFGRVNLKTRDVYSSPYFYLHDNDVVYVEPGKGKVAQSDRVYQIIPVILSVLSFLTIFITYTRR